MDAQTFDRLVAAAARHTTRRTALRLLGAALLGTLLPARVAAQRSDGDQDGLFDDDETNVYGTRPDVFDTDGDGIGDGEEIYNRDQGLPGPKDPLVNENAAPPAEPAPAPAPTCVGFGGACSAHSTCCGYDTPNVLCCFGANGVGACTDVSVRSFTCPDPGVPAAGCPDRQIDCGGFCADLAVDHGNCGFCGNRCSQLGPDYSCVSGACSNCSPGLTRCNGVCVDLLSDALNCGVCGNGCPEDRAPIPGTDAAPPIMRRPCINGQCSLPF